MEQIKFQVKIGVKDLYHFLMVYNYKSVGGIFGVGLSLACLFGFFISWNGKWDGSQVLLLLAGLLFTVIQPVMLWKKAMVQVLKNPVFKQPLEYALSEKGISIAQGEQESQLPWTSIIKVKADREQILLYTSRVNACIWPKKQLAEQEAEVLQFLEQYCQVK